jgi:hypothetical protein
VFRESALDAVGGFVAFAGADVRFVVGDRLCERVPDVSTFSNLAFDAVEPGLCRFRCRVEVEFSIVTERLEQQLAPRSRLPCDPPAGSIVQLARAEILRACSETLIY